MKRIAAAATLFAALMGAAAAQQPLPIFDTHIHYGRSDWGPYPVASVFSLWDKAGVPRALVSSTPDDGTLMLFKANADRVVPVLRPYRDGIGSGNWFNDPDLVSYLEGRLKAGIYKGIGEFHLFDAKNAGTAQVKRVTEMAIARDIFLHVHSGAAPIQALFEVEPKLKILWAHAGMSEPARVVGEMLGRYPALITEVSFRAGDIAPGDRLSPAWREVLEKFPDRFLIGTDTYVTPRWDSYAALVDEHRRWLAQLPRELAERIAFRNAVRLFGGAQFPQ